MSSPEWLETRRRSVYSSAKRAQDAIRDKDGLDRPVEDQM
jgi:hypothetical protein